MKKLVLSLLLICSGITLISCANNKITDPTQKAPGFLSDYSILQKMPSNEDGITRYGYINPNFKRKDYHAVMLDPVILYQTVKKESGITPETLYQTKEVLDTTLREAVMRKFNVTSQPDVGVARLSVAITGAEVEGDGFKLRNLIPVSAVIRLATIATGYDNKKAVLVVEAKLVDSKTGALLGEGVNIISGDKFRSEVDTPSQFKTVAQSWIKNAVRIAADYQQ
jgi:hypothetical protein